ncbi:MAG: response regulator [Actinobacteria bacterium]|nr:response regulator [Actinomycetota bacterium]MBV8958555.1 response regulator [Actinomycetota bacterium]
MDRTDDANAEPTVLVVDDAPDIRLLIREVLRHSGFAVTEAEDGGQALERLATGPLPTVIVLDVQMPGVDGWATLEALRADPRTAGVPVVLCTVRSHPADQLRAWELGCDAFLGKPFSIDDLIRQVQDLARADLDARLVNRARHLALARSEAAAVS